jgi:ferric-dicitrate binding protein FerR (iron transport regulator)
MSRNYVLGIALVAFLALPVVARAHGGHVHKVMGTVTALENSQLSVRTQDGKTVTIVLNDKTAVVRGKTKLDLTALKAGERVVVDTGDGKAPVTAREVKLGEVAPATAKK